MLIFCQHSINCFIVSKQPFISIMLPIFFLLIKKQRLRAFEGLKSINFVSVDIPNTGKKAGSFIFGITLKRKANYKRKRFWKTGLSAKLRINFFLQIGEGIRGGGEGEKRSFWHICFSAKITTVTIFSLGFRDGLLEKLDARCWINHFRTIRLTRCNGKVLLV